MSSVTRIITALALVAVVAAAAWTIAAPGSAEAGNAVATCTKAPDLRYDCTKLLAVNDHIALNANGGTCHANVTATGTISATLKSASLTVNHNVSNCYWQSGTSIAIGYRVMATPTPTGGPVSVGGVGGLLDGGTVAAPTSASGGSNAGLSIALVLAASFVVLACAAVFMRWRSKAGAVRE